MGLDANHLRSFGLAVSQSMAHLASILQYVGTISICHHFGLSNPLWMYISAGTLLAINLCIWSLNRYLLPRSGLTANTVCCVILVAGYGTLFVFEKVDHSFFPNHLVSKIS